MGIKEKLQRVVYKADLFSSVPTLRIKSSSYLETIFGGILSLVIIVVLSVIFIQSLVDVLNRIDISYQQAFEDDPLSAVDITSLQFAVGIDGQDFTVSPSQFQVNLVQVSYYSVNGSIQNSTTLVPLSFCNVSDWKDQGQQFQKQFYGLGMDKMYCLSPSQNISLYGYDGSLPYRFLTLQIRMCNSSKAGCDTSANVQTMMTNYLTLNSLFRVRLFVANTLFTPSKDVPIAKMIQKNLLLSFTSTTATVGYIYIGDYTVATDQSIFLVTQNSYVTGTYIDTSTTTTVPITGTSKYLIAFNIYKSTKSLTISRSYGKIDSLLSYIGGLFGLVMAFISFFFANYSSLCYEMAVAEANFSLDENGKRYREKSFNFLTYIKFSLYDWLSAFGINCNWQSMQQIANLKDQVQGQLDINVILKRIRHLQAVSRLLMSQHKYLSLYLATPPTLEQNKVIKQAISFYDELLERLEQNKEVPQISSKQVANEMTQFQIFQDGLAMKEKMQKQLFSNQEAIDKMFVQALTKLKGEKDYNRFCDLISKRITEAVPTESSISKNESGALDKLQLDLKNDQL